MALEASESPAVESRHLYYLCIHMLGLLEQNTKDQVA